MSENSLSKKVARSAVIASIYFISTLTFASVAFGPIQFRPGEALTLLPAIMPEAVIGVTIGCLLSNVLSPVGLHDIVFGTLITFVAAILTRLLKKTKFLYSLPPVILNAFFLPVIWLALKTDTAYWVNFGSILASQSLVCFLLGIPLCHALKKGVVKKEENEEVAQPE